MARKITDDIVRKIVRPREAHLHKGDCGRVLIGAGSVGMAGAAILASRGALRAGAGLVRACVPAELVTILQIAVPEATCVDRTQLVAGIETSALAQYDAICIGPGLGESAESIAFVKAMLSSYGGVLVVDADALNIIAHNDMLGDLRDRAEHFPDTTVVTPHIGEARRLLAAALGSESAAASGTVALGASHQNQAGGQQAGLGFATAPAAAHADLEGGCGGAAGPENLDIQNGRPAPPTADASATGHASAAASAARTFDFTGAAPEAARLAIAAALVAATRATVILKGSGTIVASPDREPLINTTGNPGMATGGSGDVLAGVITGLAAQKRQPAAAALGTNLAAASTESANSTRIGAYAAAVAAVYIHGRAGDLAAAALGEYGLIAGDLPLYVAHAIHELTARAGDLK